MRERDSVDEVLQRSLEMDVPAEVEARLRGQFADFRARLGQQRHPAREWVASLAWYPRYRWAAAAAALAIVIALVVLWSGTDGSRVYAAAVSRLATARSVQYTVEVAPFVTLEFSHLAPAQERINTSWGIEIRMDGSGTQLVLLHGVKQYVRERKGLDGLARTSDLIEQLTSLPRSPDSSLGERVFGGKRLVGYRVLGTRMPGAHGVQSLDLWLVAGTGALDHVDVTPAGAGASGYQMHIRDIRVDGAVDPAVFDMTPPRGYVDATSVGQSGPPDSAPSSDLASLQPQIVRAGRQSALVIPMSGSYLQATAAVASVSQHLQQRGLAPLGPAFGRFESESHWAVGYPVPPGTTSAPPFEVVTLPEGPVASVLVHGPWGSRSAARWSWLLSWLGERGYIAAGPPTEAWSGDATTPEAQVTEMRIAVVASQR